MNADNASSVKPEADECDGSFWYWDEYRTTCELPAGHDGLHSASVGKTEVQWSGPPEERGY